MEFGIFSNGFRPHTTAAQTYEEDLAEIIHADKLGFKYAFISEHHGEPVYIDKVDTLPVPELLMCKAAALTKQIRMGAAVKLIHLAHPVDTAIQAAVTDHVVGGGRFIFGFGSGFPNPLFAGERGLSHTDRHGRMRESLDLILKCWRRRSRSTGTANTGRARTSSPRRGRSPCRTCRWRPRPTPRRRSIWPARAAIRCCARSSNRPDRSGRRPTATRAPPRPPAAQSRSPMSPSRATSISPTAAARPWTICVPSINYELGYQKARGLIRIITSNYDLGIKGDDVSFDQLAEAGVYFLGDPDSVAKQLRDVLRGASAASARC